LDEETKMKRCDFIIINNEEELVIPQVLKLHNKLLHLQP
jgi:dephospho-CoA kinase